jgi:hypothetical protein
MFEIDHIPVWTRDRDGVLQRLQEATGLPILEGFAPDGRRAARGLRFSNGPFIDVHQADRDGLVFLGLVRRCRRRREPGGTAGLADAD